MGLVWNSFIFLQVENDGCQCSLLTLSVNPLPLPSFVFTKRIYSDSVWYVMSRLVDGWRINQVFCKLFGSAKGIRWSPPPPTLLPFDFPANASSFSSPLPAPWIVCFEAHSRQEHLGGTSHISSFAAKSNTAQRCRVGLLSKYQRFKASFRQVYVLELKKSPATN
jgi:hypothetical protein